MTRVTTKVEIPHVLNGPRPVGIEADIAALRDLYLESPGRLAVSDQGIVDELFYNPIGAECIVAYDKDAQGRTLEGFVQYIVEPDLNDVHVENLYVDSDRRKKGVGRALMEKVFQEARRQGMDAVKLYASDSDAVNFYERIGMHEAKGPDDVDMPMMKIDISR